MAAAGNSLLKAINAFLPGNTQRVYAQLRKVERADAASFRQQEVLLELLKPVPKAEAAKILFNYWAANNYQVDMKEHTEAAKKVLDKVRHDLPPSYDKLQDCQRQKNTEAAKKILGSLELPNDSKSANQTMIILDPFAGPGEVTKHLVGLVAEESYEKTGSKLNTVLFANDIAENMMKRAKARFRTINNKTRIIGLEETIFNFLDDNLRTQMKLMEGSVDIIIVSQVMDVIKDIEAKRHVLGICHDLLKFGGKLVFIGEDPPRFSPRDKTIIKVLAQTIFDAMNKTDADRELRTIRNGRLNIIGESIQTIDADHVMFSKVAEKRYVPSSKDSTPPAPANGEKKPA